MSDACMHEREREWRFKGFCSWLKRRKRAKLYVWEGLDTSFEPFFFFLFGDLRCRNQITILKRFFHIRQITKFIQELGVGSILVTLLVQFIVHLVIFFGTLSILLQFFNNCNIFFL